VFLTASLPLGLLLINPAELLLFFAAWDSIKLRVLNFSALGVLRVTTGVYLGRARNPWTG
jgi:hypothetical protein